MTPPSNPAELAESLTVREGLYAGAAAMALAVGNARLATELQGCVAALIAQREAS